MVTEVSKWQAKDGTQFDTRGEAEAHEARSDAVDQMTEVFYNGEDSFSREQAKAAARLVMGNLGWMRNLLNSTAERINNALTT